jgi:hypothetical protein
MAPKLSRRRLVPYSDSWNKGVNAKKKTERYDAVAASFLPVEPPMWRRYVAFFT